MTPEKSDLELQKFIKQFHAQNQKRIALKHHLATQYRLLRLYIRMLSLRRFQGQYKPRGLRQSSNARRAMRHAHWSAEKMCTRCGVAKARHEFAMNANATDDLQTRCKACAKEVTAAWREIPGNRERGHQANQTWLAKPGNKEKKALADREWHQAHPENVRLSEQRRRERHKDDPAFRLYHRQKTQAWERANPENVRQRANRRNSRKRGLPQIDRVDLDILYKRDKGLCSICFKHVKRPEASQDHIIPITQEGSEESYRNSALAHIDCNRRKNNRVVTQQLRLF